MGDDARAIVLALLLTAAWGVTWGVTVAWLVGRLVTTQAALRRAQAHLAEADETIRELMAQSRRMAELAIKGAVTLQVDTTPLQDAINQADAALHQVQRRSA